MTTKPVKSEVSSAIRATEGSVSSKSHPTACEAPPTTLKSTAKLFVVVRADLPPGQQVVQAAHVFREFVEEHRQVERDWYKSSNHLAVLSVADERALYDLLEHAESRGLRVSTFREPDRGDELTAIALEPAAKRLCSRLKLALGV